ncbi:MAG TPA: DUF2683 family protein [Candidatus Nanoarchaeia archaeon]|nr:DUF2683 family protein [Candidatus Nanoarchaeia archaeon]
MVQALIEIDENTNRVLNMVKAKYDLKNKGEAIKFVVTEFIEFEGEPELRPEYLEKLKKIQKEKGTSFKNIEELRKHIEHA